MRFTTLLSLLVVSFVCLTVAQVSYDDCCLRHRKLVPAVARHAVKYRQQLVDGGCNLPATIFITRRGKHYCTDPKDKSVLDLMKLIANKPKSKSKHSKKQYKGRGP